MTRGHNRKIQKQLEKNHKMEALAVGQDVLKKFKETQQVYIIGHDTPISVSNEVFAMCRRALEALAQKRNVSVIQLEMEDLFAEVFGGYVL